MGFGHIGFSPLDLHQIVIALLHALLFPSNKQNVEEYFLRKSTVVLGEENVTVESMLTLL